MVTEPVTLAVVTSALTHLGLKAIDGTLSEAGKDLWKNVKERLGLTIDPSPEDLPASIGSRLKNDGTLTNQLTELLRSHAGAGKASALVGHLQADKVVVAGTLNVTGDFKM
jgi:hypothetical protein